MVSSPITIGDWSVGSVCAQTKRLTSSQMAFVPSLVCPKLGWSLPKVKCCKTTTTTTTKASSSVRGPGLVGATAPVSSGASGPGSLVHQRRAERTPLDAGHQRSSGRSLHSTPSLARRQGPGCALRTTPSSSSLQSVLNSLYLPFLCSVLRWLGVGKVS